MDLVCTRCGEPWALDHVLHDDPAAFERTNGVIRSCPACPRREPRHTPKKAERLAAVAALGEMLGEDIDGLAATLEDFGLLED